MSTTHIHTLIFTLLSAFSRPIAALAQVRRDQGIILLEPINGVRYIPTEGAEGLGVFGFYFNLLYPWIVGMGAGIAVLMAVVGGLQIIQAGADSAKVTAGKNRLLLSLGGLLIILLSATILNILNPVFFR